MRESFVVQLTPVERQRITALRENPAVHAILDHTHPSWITGGTLRDCLFFCRHLPPLTTNSATNSLDVATALPFDVLLRRLAPYRVITTNQQHKSLCVQITPNTRADITCLRIDITTDGRHATTDLAFDIHTDSKRRDFTINALYLSKAGQVFDFHGGKRDLLDHRLRFIGDPHQKLEEDILRLLRFFRFLSVFHDSSILLDEETLTAIRCHRQRLTKLSAMRLTTEFIGLLQTPRPEFALHTMKELGVLETAYFPINGCIPDLQAQQHWRERLILLLQHTNLHHEQALGKLELKKTDRLYLSATLQKR